MTIERCIEFCQLLEPAFATLLRGSPPEDIDALEDAAGRPLSLMHRRFLEVMGEDSGSLDLGDYSVSPRHLLAKRGDAMANLAEGTELFAIPTLNDEGDILLRAGTGGDLAVVRRVSDYEEHVAGSLEELLCLPMLNARYVALQPLQAAFTQRELRDGALADCRRIAELFGFETYWFSNAITWAARRRSLVLVAKQPPGLYFSAGIAGREEFEHGVIARTLERELDLQPYQ
ncbi:MAG TPA: hypothetical protein VGQ36_05165 [Thermoanaerobaculia bacterium]|jgi:hypothetical protein|nr:hypothetical protein [Thermoanaerobaculia bacterium]